MIDEYRPLFRTRLFNLCADETFDLGLGRSQEYCRQVGKDTAYVGFVKKLRDHLIQKGCRPMMWGHHRKISRFGAAAAQRDDLPQLGIFSDGEGG